jgi:hypothetical protein
MSEADTVRLDFWVSSWRRVRGYSRNQRIGILSTSAAKNCPFTMNAAEAVVATPPAHFPPTSLEQGNPDRSPAIGTSATGLSTKIAHPAATGVLVTPSPDGRPFELTAAPHHIHPRWTTTCRGMGRKARQGGRLPYT